MKVIEKVKFLDFIWKSASIYKDPLPFHHENFGKHNNTFKISPKKDQTIFFTCNELIIQHMLQKNQRNYYKSPLQTQDLAKYIGNGLLTANGDKWKANRSLIQPAFHKKQLAHLLDAMHVEIDKNLSRIEPNVPLDVHALFNDLAFRVVAKSLFYIDDIENEITRLQEITEKAQKMLIKELRLPFLSWYFNREWLSGKKSVPHHLELIQEARGILQNIIKNRRNLKEEKGDLLDMLLHATYEDGTGMSDDQLIDEILVLFTAGHETTANVLSFAVQLLAKHKGEQEKVYEESLIFEDTDFMTSLKSLENTKHCLEETMRLYPPAYVTDRIALEEDTCDDYTIPKDSIWLISFYEMHRRKDLWENPHEFIPDRFKNAKEFSDFYFPFGAGPRMCIGNNFAMFEMQMVLVKILKKYRLELINETIDYHALITLRPKNALVTFTER